MHLLHSDKKPIKLILFFTRGNSLYTWDKVGMLDREVSLYQRLQEHGVQVTFVTYGNASDLHYASRIPGIPILCNRWGLISKYYEYWLPVLHGWHLWRSDVYKSNQTNGADLALRTAQLFHKPLIARCGYLHSEFVERSCGVNSREARQARELEKRVFTSADQVVVTTPVMRNAVGERYTVAEERIQVIPNYVQTDLFYPYPNNHAADKRICFVGRLDEQKNLFSLLKAIKCLDVELVIVGSGTLDRRLREEVSLNKLPVDFMGNVPHHQLPEILNSAALFILPSHYEGHPKALLEAMACGLPVIGSNVSGIRELIRHGETGFLCGTSPEGIREAIQCVLANADLRNKMSHNARNFVMEHFQLERVVKTELTLLKELLEKQ